MPTYTEPVERKLFLSQNLNTPPSFYSVKDLPTLEDFNNGKPIERRNQYFKGVIVKLIKGELFQLRKYPKWNIIVWVPCQVFDIRAVRSNLRHFRIVDEPKDVISFEQAKKVMNEKEVVKK